MTGSRHGCVNMVSKALDRFTRCEEEGPGQLVATEAGIHAASRFLRHADIQITAAYYADREDAYLSV